MRISRVWAGACIASALVLAGCGSDGGSDVGPDVVDPTPSVEVTEPELESDDRVVEFVAVDDGMLGMHVAGAHEGAFPSSRVPVESLRLWDTGTSWAQIEINRGRYDWRGLDRALDTAAKAGVDDVLMILGPTPTWNARTLDGVHYPLPGAASVPRSLAAWDAFISATVDRYAGRITAYQIWNEASLKMFWRGSGDRMAELTKRAYDIIKAGDPQALVVAASSTVRLPGAYERFFPAYLEGLAERGWPIDVMAIHSYPTGEQNPQDRAENLQLVRETLAAMQAPDLPLWDTELNYGLAGPGDIPRTEITGDTAVSWTVRTYLDSLKFDVSRTYWYIWTPQPYDLLGIQMTNRSAAAAGLRTVQDWLAGGEWGGCVVEGIVNSCLVRKGGVISEVLWSDAANGLIEGFAEGAQVCDARNDCTDVSGGSLSVTSDPVRITPAR